MSQRESRVSVAKEEGGGRKSSDDSQDHHGSTERIELEDGTMGRRDGLKRERKTSR